MFDLTGKVAIVTGGNGGIGLGMARGLARAGARVVVAGRNRDKSARAVAELDAIGPGGALAIAVDVTDDASVTALFAETAERCGRLDTLINNAGINVRKPLQSVTLAEWHRVIDTNLTSAYLCSHAAYPLLQQAGRGKVINIGSILSMLATEVSPVYAASKGGILQLTRACATAWARDHIQVNCVLPGWIDTELTEGTRRDVPGWHEAVVKRTPAGRWGTIDDLSGVAVFLSAPASDFVTGAAITVDGGYSIQG
ncbi:MAG TPA: glucose 1-dehydrogenase [Kofleriaceae bacterium]|jgi:2-deoxy-D-gluconate 3-dehydrogenase|nr:glucose 1-dehydrogenase [Kofleriaceae bacterium]